MTCSDHAHNPFLFFFFFSPSGKLVQIEYALQAVAAGAPSVGIKGLISECIYRCVYLTGNGTTIFGLGVPASDCLIIDRQY